MLGSSYLALTISTVVRKHASWVKLSLSGEYPARGLTMEMFIQTTRAGTRGTCAVSVLTYYTCHNINTARTTVRWSPHCRCVRTQYLLARPPGLLHYTPITDHSQPARHRFIFLSISHLSMFHK